MGKKPPREANRPDDWSLSLDPHTRKLPTPDVWDKVLVNEVALLANFLQSHARDVGVGQVRGYSKMQTLDHDIQRSTEKRKGVQARYLDTKAPHNSITLQMRRWGPSEKKDWDTLPIEARMNVVEGYPNPPSDWALLFTVQVLIMSKVSAKFAYSLLDSNISSSAVVLIDRQNKRPLLCGWTEDFHNILPKGDDMFGSAKNMNVKQKKKFFGGVYKRRNDLGGKAAQVLLDEPDRRECYTQKQQDFITNCQVDSWAQLAETLFEMAREPSHELLTTGAEFRSRWLFRSQPRDRADPSNWHAVAAECKSKLKDTLEAEGSDGPVGDGKKGTEAKKKNQKASKKSKGKEKTERKGRSKKKEKSSAKAEGKVRAKARVVISDADDDELEPEMEDQDDTSFDEATTLTSKAGQRRTSFRNTRYEGNLQVAPVKEDGLPYFDDGWDGVVADDNDEESDFADE